MSDPLPDSPESVKVAESDASEPVLFNPAASDEIPDMPEVQDHAIKAAQERKQAAATPEPSQASGFSPAVKGKTDIDGRPYDPTIHEVPMRINRDGWIAKRRGGGSKSGKPSAPLRSRVVPPGQGPQAVAAEAPPDPSVQIEASAQMCAGLFFTGATFLGGEEFAPDDKSEQEFIVGSLKNYFTAKGCPDIPPGVALAGALGFYVAKRWSRPKFQERRKGWWQWIKDTVSSFRKKNDNLARG